MPGIDTLKQSMINSYQSNHNKDQCHIIAEVRGSNPLLPTMALALVSVFVLLIPASLNPFILSYIYYKT